MSAVYGAGFLNFLPGTDRSEEECIQIMTQLTEKTKPGYPIVEVIGEKVGQFEYDEKKEKVYFSWLPKEDADKIIEIQKKTGGSAPWSYFEYVNFETLIPVDFVDDYSITLDLPDGETVYVRCSSMLMSEDRLRWINEDLESGEKSGTEKLTEDELIGFHKELIKDFEACANPGLMYCIR